MRTSSAKCLSPNMLNTYNDIFHGETDRQTLVFHYNDVIMSAIASRITSLRTVYLIIYLRADQRKLPTQRASNAENGSI